MKTVFLLNIPVLHEGYIKLFAKYPETKTLYLIGEELLDRFRAEHSAKEIRAIPDATMVALISSLNKFETVSILTPKNLEELKEFKIITANEKISHQLAGEYFKEAGVIFDSTFLRWDEDQVLSLNDIKFNSETADSFDVGVIKQISLQAQASSDWWRQVGAAAVKDNKILLEAHNQHLPTESTPYINGDPRDFVQAGTNSHLTSAIHAEQSIIAEAARKGISLEDASIYVTVFPCPVCAKLIAYSGFKKCYFASGHASLDGEEVLKSYNVELIKVALNQ